MQRSGWKTEDFLLDFVSPREEFLAQRERSSPKANEKHFFDFFWSFRFSVLLFSSFTMLDLGLKIWLDFSAFFCFKLCVCVSVAQSFVFRLNSVAAAAAISLTLLPFLLCVFASYDFFV